MRRLWMKLRLCLGGAVCGGLSGIALGAFVGAVVGLLNDDVSQGLDGSLIGGGLGIVAGAFYGVAVAAIETDARSDSILVIGSDEELPPSEQARTLPPRASSPSSNATRSL